MNVEMFTVYDLAAKRYMDPFPAPTIEFAIRGFKEACGSEGHQFAKYPEDYVLYRVASFDAESGLMEGHLAEKLAMATDFTGQFGNQLDIEGEKQA